jgi:hypothetical protein
MNRFVVFNEDEEGVTRLRLVVDHTDGTVDLVAVNADGEVLRCGHILNVGPEGVLLYSDVNAECGIKTDRDRYVVTTKD